MVNRTGPEVVLRLPTLDPNTPVSPRDRLVEIEVNAMLRHLRERSRKSKAMAAEFGCALLEATARFSGALAIGVVDRNRVTEFVGAWSKNLADRMTSIINGQPFGIHEAPLPKTSGSSTAVADLLEVMPPLAEEGDFGALAQHISRDMALAGLDRWQSETAPPLEPQQMGGALLIAAAESTVVVALASANPERAEEAIAFVCDRIKARASQAIDARKAKMG